MTNAERLQRWNQWYEQTPETWRFQIVVWALVIVGAVNMLLTIAVGFPFALLVGLAVAAIAAVRVPYVLGWVRKEGGAAGGPILQIQAPSWVIRVNRWYDGLDEMQRPLVLLAALAIPGAINMLLTFAGGFPFGLLFLLAVIAVIAIRAPYTAGWLNERPADGATTGPALSVAPPAPRIGGESAGAPSASSTAMPASRPAEPAPIVPEDKPAKVRPRAANGAPSAEPPA